MSFKTQMVLSQMTTFAPAVTLYRLDALGVAMASFVGAYGDDLQAFVERLLTFDTSEGRETSAQDWFEQQLAVLDFETYRWTPDSKLLAAHRSFPDDPAAIDEDRPSVAGALTLGSGDGPTLVLNGHADVVPADEGAWSSDPFTPTWSGDHLTARGAADMKAGLGACVFAARYLADRAADWGVDGRVVVESVAGEEEGGLGAATAALTNPYPFGRDAAVISEPTALRPVVACEGSLMARLQLTGRSAHAATPQHGESVLPHFERIRRVFEKRERERARHVTHPLYRDHPRPWPVVCGTIRAGSWASTVPASLVAGWRIGVAPGETVAEVEREFCECLKEVAGGDEWLREHPPEFERFSVQFEPSEVDPAEPVVGAVQAAMSDRGLAGTDPVGVTYGSDARHYIEAGIPTVLFGPGSIETAHFPDETVTWPEVLTSGAVLANAVLRYFETAA